MDHDKNTDNPRLKWRSSEQRCRKALKKYIKPENRNILKDAFNETNYPSDYSTSSGEDEFIQRAKPRRKFRHKKDISNDNNELKHQVKELNKAMDKHASKPATSYNEYYWRTAVRGGTIQITV